MVACPEQPWLRLAAVDNVELARFALVAADFVVVAVEVAKAFSWSTTNLDST